MGRCQVPFGDKNTLAGSGVKKTLAAGDEGYQRRDGEYTKKYTLGCIECIEYPSLWDAEGGLWVS